ncbi:TetR/AcrR family transcriptional regulator [Streptomyces sp. NPDC002851]
MGHREDLLEGAKRCLIEKGWRTTARDIVAESGTNLASIGYHYGSKDALLREAMFAAMGDWGDEIEAAMHRRVRPDASLGERFESGWNLAVEVFGKHRGLWRAQFEAIMRSDTDPQMRAAFVKAQPEGRAGLVAMFNGLAEEDLSEEDIRIFGSFYMTLVSGMVVQMALDPEVAPKGKDIVEAIRRLAA